MRLFANAESVADISMDTVDYGDLARKHGLHSDNRMRRVSHPHEARDHDNIPQAEGAADQFEESTTEVSCQQVQRKLSGGAAI